MVQCFSIIYPKDTSFFHHQVCSVIYSKRATFFYYIPNGYHVFYHQFFFVIYPKSTIRRVQCYLFIIQRIPCFSVIGTMFSSTKFFFHFIQRLPCFFVFHSKGIMFFCLSSKGYLVFLSLDYVFPSCDRVTCMHFYY